MTHPGPMVAVPGAAEVTAPPADLRPRATSCRPSADAGVAVDVRNSRRGWPHGDPLRLATRQSRSRAGSHRVDTADQPHRKMAGPVSFGCPGDSAPLGSRRHGHNERPTPAGHARPFHRTGRGRPTRFRSPTPNPAESSTVHSMNRILRSTTRPRSSRALPENRPAGIRIRSRH